MKPVQVKMMQRKYGDHIYWAGYARGRSFGQFNTLEAAGGWMELMVRNGFSVHPNSDVRPSGVMPTEGWIAWCEGHVKEIKAMIENHPRKGKSIWEGRQYG